MLIVLSMKHLTKARRIALEIEELKKQSKVFRNRFKMLVEAQLRFNQYR